MAEAITAERTTVSAFVGLIVSRWGVNASDGRFRKCRGGVGDTQGRFDLFRRLGPRAKMKPR